MTFKDQWQGKSLPREKWKDLNRLELAEQIDLRKALKNELSGGWLYASILDDEIAELRVFLGGRSERIRVLRASVDQINLRITELEQQRAVLHEELTKIGEA